MSECLETIILGDEHDHALRDALRVVLISGGAIGIETTWAVGGSQEIETIRLRLGTNLITVESETFIGLAISGPKFLIDDIAEQVRRQLGL